MHARIRGRLGPADCRTPSGNLFGPYMLFTRVLSARPPPLPLSEWGKRVSVCLPLELHRGYMQKNVQAQHRCNPLHTGTRPSQGLAEWAIGA